MSGPAYLPAGSDALALVGLLASVVNQARDTAALLAGAVDAIATACGWPQGEAWVPGNDDRLARAPGSFAATPAAGTFNLQSADLRLRRGEGLAGRAWASDAVIALQPLQAVQNYWRHDEARAAGFHAAIAVPVFHAGALECVLCFHAESLSPGAALETQLLTLAGRVMAGAWTRLAGVRGPSPVHEQIAESAGVALVEFRPGDEHFSASAATRALLDLAPDAPMPSRSAFFAMLDPDDAARVRLAQARAIETPGARVPVWWHFSIRTSAGHRKQLVARGALVRSPAGGDAVIRLAVVDATEAYAQARAEMDARIRTAEARHRALFERHPLPVLVVAGEGELIVDANEAARTLYGLDAATIGRVAKRSLLAPDDTARYRAWRERGLAGRDVRTARHRTADGREIDVLVASEPIEHDGEKARIAVVTDITDRLSMERRLHESMQRLELVLDTMVEGVVLQDAAGRIVLWNRAAETILAHTPEQMAGKTSLDPNWAARDEDGNDFPGERHPATLARTEGRVAEGVMEISAGDGRRTWVSIRSAPLFDIDGEVSGSVSTFTDVTESRAARRALEESEARYRLVVERTSDMIARQDPSGVFTWVSRSSRQLLGLEPEALIGHHPLEFVHPEDAARIAEQRVEARASAGDVVGPTTLRLRNAAGEYVWVEVTSTPVLDASGALVDRITTTRDVGDRRILEQRLAHAAKMEAVGTLAGGIAHDFNNVLTIIGGGLEALDALLPGDDAVVRTELEAIGGAATRAQALTRQLLTFARRNVEQVATVPLDDVVRRAAPLLRRLLKGGQELQLHCEAGDAAVTLDAAELELALMNLVSNARAAMGPRGAVHITTAVVELDAQAAATLPLLREGRWLTLVVRDTGAGMSEAVRERIFEPFYTTKAAGEGTGLGLATVYGVVQRAHGAITVESAEGVGTTFTIWLPVRAPGSTGPALDEEPAPAPERPASRRTTPDSTTPTADAPRRTACGAVLVVDDEPAVRAVTRRALVRAGWTVLEAADAESAMAQLVAIDGDVDVLLTDFAMPGGSGRVLIEEATARWPRLRTVLMSGYTDDELTRTALQRTATGFLPKPFTTAALVAAVAATAPATTGASGTETAGR